jgi:uncharacterized Fe-S cluster protein YjdI
MVSDTSMVRKAFVGDCFSNQFYRYHCPTYGILNIVDCNTKCFKRNIWLFDHGNYDEYRQKLSNVNWDNLLRESDVNTCAIKFNETVLNHAKSCIPNKTVTIRQADPPWITTTIRQYVNVNAYTNVQRKLKSTRRGLDLENNGIYV